MASNDPAGPSFPAFPYTPYPIQQEFMQNLYEALEQGQVGLFESPTGTGKTLSIICSVLQWLEDYRKALEAVAAAEELATQQPAEAGDPDIPAWMLQQQQQKQQEQQEQRKTSSARAAAEQIRKRKAAVKQFGGTGSSAAAAAGETDEFLLEPRQVSSSDDDSDDDLLGERDQVAAQRKVPQVIFCSRTHSQLSQFVGELYRTPFADWVELVALGSRKNLCVNDQVLRLGQVQLINERCMELQRSKSSKAAATGAGANPTRSRKPSKGGCPFLRTPASAAANFQSALLAAPLDVEELARLGRQQAVCPYYGSRRAVPAADVLLVPYSAVLQPETRRSLGIELEGSVVVFDEAHNLLNAINGAHSAAVTAEQLSSCVAQLSGYFDRYKARLNPANAAQLQQLSRLASLFLDCLRQHSSGPGSTVQQATPAAPSSTAAGAAPGCRVLTCSRFLIELSIDNINLFPLLEWLRESKVLFKVSGYAASAAQAAGSVQLQRPAPQAAAGAAAEAPEAEARESLPSLHAFVGFLQALTNTNTDGRVIIDCQAQQAPSKQVAASTAAGTGTGTTSEAATRPGSNSSTRSSVRAAPQAQLRFVLLNAAGHFSKILQGARSVVLASGTLAPVEALRAQLFPAVPDKGIRHFECGHVIDADNLVALAVGKGPSGAVLDFRHEQRGAVATMDEAGRLVANLAAVVPQGLVAFAPSFAYCEQLLQRWEASGLLPQLSARKKFFREPRSAAEVESVLQQYSACIEEGQGAVMLSVVGGKLSEGINFGDGLGRCVVILGMPYPNPSDPELQERMRFFDAAAKAGQPGITGREYYDNLCMNAVNQCVGRVIRHRNDYAAIVLADARYAQHRARSPVQKLPKWIQTSFCSTDGTFGAGYGRLKAFFNAKQAAAEAVAA